MGVVAGKGFPIGSRHGKWTVLVPVIPERRSHALMRCDCGVEKPVWRTEVTRGGSLSCFHCSSVKHGLTHTRTYRTWVSMRARCMHKSHPAYANYGGRGISICER